MGCSNQILKISDAVAVEDLQIRNMMKRCQPIKYEAGRFLSNGQSAKGGLNRF
jgi:putative transposase